MPVPRLELHHARAGSLKERVVDLARGRSRADEEFLALDGVSFTIHEGDAVALTFAEPVIAVAPPKPRSTRWARGGWMAA